MKEFIERLNELKKERSFRNLFSITFGYGDAGAAEYQNDGQIKTLTYADYKRIAIGGAAKLSKLLAGTGQNTFIALRFGNGPLWPAAFWAIVTAGFNPLLIDAGADDNQIMHVLRQAGSRIIVTDTDVGVGGTTVISPFDFLDINAADSGFTPVFGNAVALCTSGTTSTPKVYVYNEQAVCGQVLLATISASITKRSYTTARSSSWTSHSIRWRSCSKN